MYHVWHLCGCFEIESKSMDTSSVLDRLTEEWESLTQEAQKAARYVLDNPQDVGVSTVRELAEAAKVKPNTVVRMARPVGFEGFEEFRAPIVSLPEQFLKAVQDQRD